MQTLRQDAEFALIRDQPEGASKAVLLLQSVQAEPSAWSLRRLEHELALAHELHRDWAVRPLALSRHAGRVTLVLEDPGGMPLRDLPSRPMEIEQFLRLAIGITHALHQMHAHGLVHKDIKPDHILVSEAGQVRLMGFSVASRVPRQRHVVQPPELLEGTLAYMAPEQTGRMNRSVDSRSDLYALGITFYEMLTGQLPFTATDALEWVHCHVARQPAPPGEHAPMPRVLDHIVLKLLEKAAEDRYQTAVGLEFDLRHCLTAWQRQKRIERFPLGRRDAPDRLVIPERLYGRELEVQALHAAFRRMLDDAKPTWMLISGYAGIGKSSIVGEFERAIAQDSALYAAGKFDQYKRNIPYAALAHAFGSLLRQRLGEDETKIERWRSALFAALGSNGQVIADLIPEIELIIGKQPPAPAVPPEDVANRFRRVFGRFLRVFARAEHPLVLFFDDLQWVDTASLDLLGFLSTDPAVRHLLLIGAYRDNEVDVSHPLRRRLDSMQTEGAHMQAIIVAPLPFGDIARMIADALHYRPEHAKELARLVFEKTGGNPFFAIQFLTNLEDEGLLTFDRNEVAWHWDLARIEAKGFTDNVAHLLAGKLSRLPMRTQETLKHLAALGDSADVRTLAILLESSEEAVEAPLREAVAAGLVVHLGETYGILHDRVQEAAYALIAERDRPALHLRIGRVLWSLTRESHLDEKIFDIVDQLDRGAELLTDARERRRVAELNLLAARRARRAMAYSTALDYLHAGKDLLPRECWTECHELAFAFQFTLGECEYFTVDFDSAEARLASLSTRATNLRDSAELAELRMLLYQTLGRIDHAIEVCLEYLRKTGIHWTATPSRDEVTAEYRRLWQRLGDRPVEDLIHLPVMNDPEQQGTLSVLASVLAPALSDRNLFQLVIGRMVNMSLEHGNSDGSSLAYLYLNSVLGEDYGDYRKGYRFGKLAIDLVEQGMTRFAHRVEVGFGITVIPWTQPLSAGLPWVRRSIDTSHERGDLTFAAYSYYLIIPYRLLLGDPLNEVQREAENALEFVRKVRFGFMIDTVAVQLGYLHALRNITTHDGSPGEPHAADHALEQRLNQSRFGNALCWFWIRKLQVSFLAEDLVAAKLAEIQARAHFHPLLTAFEDAEYHFYAALLRASGDDTVYAAERAANRQALLGHASRLDQLAADCPENFAQRASLVAAEIVRLEGRDADAQRLYEQAIRTAARQGFVHDEALALEAAACFYAARGLDAVASALLLNARGCYQRWGAVGKVQLLDQRHPDVESSASVSSPPTPGSLPNLDVMSIVKAAQALSGEMILDKLIEALLVIAVEYAGADRGVLILLHDATPWIEAEARSSREKVHVDIRRAPITPDTLPQSILNYVLRSHDSVIIENASTATSFTTDDYVRREHPRSILCQPLIKQSKLVGALYLENHLAAHAFSAQDLAILDVVAAQAAISLENALLYADLRDRESRIRRLIESNMIGVFFWSSSGDIKDANECFLNLLGYSRDDLAAGRITWASFTPPEHPEMDQRVWAQFRTQGKVAPYEKEYVRKDGTRVCALTGSTLLEGSPDQGVTFVLDLTERKQAELDRGARQIAEEANRAKSAFLAGMSHELRTPLNGILGYAQILERDRTLKDAQRNAVGVIRDSGEHLLTLINDLLDLAKIEAGKPDLTVTTVRLLDVLRVIRGIIQPKAQEKGLDLIFEIAPDLPAAVRVDERRLRQVLLNLLANAVKFTDRGQVRLIVRLEPGEIWHFEVQDSGIGIREDQQDTVFQPFEQVGDVQRHSSGTGLGLAISQQIVRMMGGEIHLQSRPGEGSRFWFDLNLPVVAAALPAPTRLAPSVTGYQGPRKTILIVDDNAGNRQVLVDLLTPLGFATAEAQNGREALDRVGTLQPDLIITDYVMPVMNGQEATRRLRQIAAMKHVPVIMLSARASLSDESECLASGVDAFMARPVDADDLFAVIATLLQLEWTSEATTATELAEGDSIAATLVPPVEAMQTLHRLALEGNMRKIILWAEQVAASDTRYRPFTNQLWRLAKEYQSRTILRLVETHLAQMRC